MRIKVEVTEEDIAKGKRGEPRSCPVARAVRRALNLKAGVEVGYTGVVVVHGVPITTNQAVGDFVVHFDVRSVHAKPFTFTLNIPKAAIKKGGGKA